MASRNGARWKDAASNGSGPCAVIAIRDRKRRGWVVYPHGDAGLGVLVAYVAHTLTDRIGRPQ